MTAPTTPDRLIHSQRTRDRTLVLLPPAEEQPTLDVSRAAKALGISRASAYEGISRGDIPSIRIGNRILVLTAELRRMVGLDPETPS